MPEYRVTKYDPELRTEGGVFTRNDWTSFADIGLTFDTGVLTYAQYKTVEDAYVESGNRFMKAAGVDVLQVQGLELYDSEFNSPASSEAPLRMPDLNEGKVVSGADLDALIRLNLRGRVWCRLAGSRGFFVHFGHDYYMYVGLPSAQWMPPVLPRGIYAEKFESPHAPKEDVDEEEADVVGPSEIKPAYITKGKSIRQLISELQTFNDQEMMVEISLDGGKTHKPISMVTKSGRFCLLSNME
jgi:hypothetical protein